MEEVVGDSAPLLRFGWVSSTHVYGECYMMKGGMGHAGPIHKTINHNTYYIGYR